LPLDGITLEGYVDLIYRDDDGLVVVDYKTDAVDDATRAERLVHYRIQAAAYAVAVAGAAGAPVVRGVLCFLTPDGASEVHFEGAELAAAIDEVHRLAAAERDAPLPLPDPVPEEAGIPA
jgi:RecB family exonuclease